MILLRKYLLGLTIFLWPISVCALNPQLTVIAVNRLSFARQNETLKLSADQLKPLGAHISLNKIHIKDANGRKILTQAIDTDGDHQPDEVIFQANFAPHQTRHFYVYMGKRHLYKKSQFKAYGRFVQERFGDFAWENDRIANRTYGKALETWKGEPLTSSAIDIWCKSVSNLVINKWYMLGRLSTDTGEGADLYKAGNSRGVGGDGLWANEKLWVSQNYIHSQLFGNGPIRVMFQLSYNPFNMHGENVKEMKRISLDAGQNLNHFRLTYKASQPGSLIAGLGIEKSDLTAKEVRKGIPSHHSAQPIERLPGTFTHKDVNANQGVITTQQPLSEGKLYGAIIVNPKDFVKVTTNKKNELVLAHVPTDDEISYWAGFAWSKSNQFKTYQAWKTYINHFAQALRSPIQVSVKRP